MMKNIALAQAALTQSPSGFAMPVCGHTGVVRDRQIARKATVPAHPAALVGGTRVAVTTGYFPGTSAWSPPTC